MQKTSSMISVLCYLIPIIVTEWLKILHLFLATVFRWSRKVLLSSFYGNGDRGAKNHFCNGTRKPPWLHRDVGQTSSCAAVLLLPGAGFGRLAHPAEGSRCTAVGAVGRPCSTEGLVLWQESSTAGHNGSGDRFLTAHRERGLHSDQMAALVTQTWFIYLHSAKHNHYETKRCQLAPQEEKRFLCVLQANSCRLTPGQNLRPVQLWKMFLKVFK